MAVVYMNGFEWNNLGENLSAYGGAAAPTLQSRISGNPVKSGDHSLYLHNDGWVEATLNSDLSEFYIQFAFRLGQAWPGTIFRVVHWKYEGTIVGTLVFDGTAQHFKIYTEDCPTGTLRLTTNASIIQNVWYYVELHVAIDPSSGVFEVRIDGITDATYSGSTQPGVDYTINRIQFTSNQCSGSYSGFYVDDIVLNDTTGSTNNSWVNCLAVQLLRPWGAGSSERWDRTSLTALNNYECVDGVPLADPTEFIYTEYGGKLDLYLIEDLPEEAYSIEAIRADAWACKSSGSGRDLELAINTNSTTYISGTHELNIYYTLYGSYWEQNLAGSTHWSVADINGLEAGVRSSF